MKIKICGMTRAQDVQLASQLGAWAVGFIFYSGSKRFIRPAQAQGLGATVPKNVQKVGVFVNQNPEVAEAARLTGLDMIQLHGDETPEDCAGLRAALHLPVIKAFRPSCPDDLSMIALYKKCVDYALIDAFVPGAYGGTGKTADFALARRVKDMDFSVILSGGLTPENIKEAEAAVLPFALDLSSGVESSPGLKEESKLRALFS